MNNQLLNRFELYQLGVDYMLPTLEKYQALSSELKPLYTIIESEMLAHFPPVVNSESFVSLTQLSQQHNLRIKIASGSTPTGSVAGVDLYLRAQAADRLRQAAIYLQQQNGHYTLWITDAYRPLTLQRHHFELIKSQLAERGYTGEDLYHRTSQVISDPDLLPPHSLGGTLDITIYDQRTQQPIDMGTVVDSIEVPLIHTWYNQISLEQKQNRILLYETMTQAGFVSTPLEWWHYSYGDPEWALRTGHTQSLYNSVEELTAEKTT